MAESVKCITMNESRKAQEKPVRGKKRTEEDSAQLVSGMWKSETADVLGTERRYGAYDLEIKQFSEMKFKVQSF